MVEIFCKKIMIIFEMSGLDYVELIVQIDHYDLIRPKTDLPVLSGNAWAGQKSVTDFMNSNLVVGEIL